MDESPYFRIVDAEPITPNPSKTAIASGSSWRVEREPDGLWLYYISGSHQGDERAILIGEGDLVALRDGERSVGEVLHTHGAY